MKKQEIRQKLVQMEIGIRDFLAKEFDSFEEKTGLQVLDIEVDFVSTGNFGHSHVDKVIGPVKVKVGI